MKKVIFLDRMSRLKMVHRYLILLKRANKTPVKNFDFMKTLTAEEANLREHGFRKVGSKLVDASKE